MNVLIISHNPMGGDSNMGKTLQSYFRAFSSLELAQFYIHPEDVPPDSLCPNCYRFTDGDALRTLIPWFRGQKKTGLTGAVYQYGRRRTAGIYLLRNLLWKCSRWDGQDFWDWVDEFSPDMVFLASGDYAFLYEIALMVADRKRVPLAVSCMDDYYLHNRNAGSVLGRLVHRSFLKTVKKTMARAGGIFTICPAMKTEYEALFGKPCDILHTPAPIWERGTGTEGTGISYIGNLGFGRDKQLARIGQVLQSLENPLLPKVLDVYSHEQDPRRLQLMTAGNGIQFHGGISSEGVREVMKNSMAVIHTESFETEMQNLVRFSVSTKIPESLRNGPCIIAYGPRGIASMDYLEAFRAAYRIPEEADLKTGLEEILTNATLREKILQNARALAEENHSIHRNPSLVKRRLEEICKAWKKAYESTTD